MKKLTATFIVLVTFTVTFLMVTIGLDLLCKSLHYYDEGLQEAAEVYN